VKKHLVIILLVLLWSNDGLAQELIKIPVHVHIVQINETIEGYTMKYKTITKRDEVLKDFEFVNDVWKQAGIFWHVIKIDNTKANVKNFNSEVLWLRKRFKKELKFVEDRIGTVLNLDELKEMRYTWDRTHKFWNQLLNIKKYQNIKAVNVYYVPSMVTFGCGLTTYDNPQSVFDLNIPLRFNIKSNVVIVAARGLNLEYLSEPCREKDTWSRKKSYMTPKLALAHEIGHVLNLEHSKDENDIMAAVSPKDTNISADYVNKARTNYKKYLKKQLN
tara:strand:- start:91 stop:915 length:825 start_codon:yes stop_codon:yes gene_type:complete